VRAFDVLVSLARSRPAWALVLALAAVGCAEGGRPPSSFDPRGAASAGAADGSPNAVESATIVRYLALGDSFTIGTGSEPTRAFPARLVERWRAAGCALALENVAVNGYTSEDVIARELPAVASFRPTLITVAVGANDIVQARSTEEYRASVRRILAAAKASGARVLAIPQPDWSRSPAAAPFGSAATLADAITRFNVVLAEEVRAAGAEWVDLVPLMHEQARRGQLASDGLHPSAEAYEAWAGEIARVVAAPCR
jgi:acyl-CoA thioesterase I